MAQLGRPRILNSSMHQLYNVEIATNCSKFSAEQSSFTTQCLNVIPNCITIDMNCSLNASVTFKEVEDVVLTWGLTKLQDLMDSMSNFFRKDIHLGID